MESKSVAIIGAGAVGSYYGGRLAEAGHDVRFLMRRDFEAVQANGLLIHSPDGNFDLAAPTIAKHSADFGTVDWVACALKSTSVEDVPALVGPCVGPDTRILVLMNGLGLEERFAEWFGEERIFGGLAFTCINRGEPGIVNHLDYGPVTIGHLLNDPDELASAAALWSNAKVQTLTATSLLRARWEKLCWNIPFNGLAVVGGGVTTDVILSSASLRQAAETLMAEVIAAGNADLVANGESQRIDGPAMIERMFTQTATMGAYRPSTMIDFVEGRVMEVAAIFREPLQRARVLGVPVPHVTLLTALMENLNTDRAEA